ncbi:MAG TPA: aspartate--tRNA ligase [Firmicutes bacterium]|nr:aspartate--tRNA ligase [Bacillota bacterium]
MLRTKNCGELRKENVGETVALCGWVSKVRNLGALVFIDLRDRYGVTQLSLTPEMYEKYHLRSEYCLRVEGEVILRSSPNKEMDTGEIEIDVKDINVFSSSANPPFIIADKTDALEDTRLKMRYLDLRRPILQKNLQIRAKTVSSMREYLEENGFLEIETPTLIKSTPEGARDYLVPSRLKPGTFYALPQSPQIYKQLLMIAGMDKYYQVARCYRDEDLRADRQPEFTQIDVEMSFVEREDVLLVIQGMLKKAFKDVLNVDLKDFARLTYAECISKYGSDKPDLRYTLYLHDLDEIFKNSTFALFNNVHIKGFKVDGYAEHCSRKMQDEDARLLSDYHLHAPLYIKKLNGELTGSVIKNLSQEEIDSLVKEFELKDNDVLVLDFNSDYENLSLGLGALRKTYASRANLIDENVYEPLFVLDWPIFGRENGEIVSLSNPFTRPKDEHVKYLYEDPTKALSYAYDTVINGIELSSGSLRIYDAKVQERIFELLNLSEEEIKAKFGFFVDALKYGTPPHGGFAFGLDRLVMIFAHTDNIREVIAFPKNLQAACPMAQAPSKVDDSALKILHIKTVDEEKDE